MASAMASFVSRYLRNRTPSLHYTCRISRIPTAEQPYCSSTRQYLHSIGIRRRGMLARRGLNMDMKAIMSNPPALPPPPRSPFPGWSIWMLLSVIPILIPIFTGNWGPSMKFKKKMDTALQDVEYLAEAVEDVAETVDKIGEEVSEHLPGDSRLKKIINKIDEVAEETIKAAECAEQLLEKVKDAEKKIEMIEESTKEQAAEATKGAPSKKKL